MSVTVDGMCDALLLSGIMPPDDVSALRKRWFKPDRSGAQEVERFSKWLVMNQFLTELQAAMLVKGQAENLVLNQYKMLERIGKGRLAGVYKATDADGQVVAIKVLPPSKAKNPETLMRFEREARLAMKLHHPNVVRTLDAGEANGKHYIVMEYLEGSTLEEVLQKKGKLAPVEAARIIGHALLGLQHMHEQQMVHRDLQPANLMLTSIPVPGQSSGATHRVVKILDIGLGRALFDEGDGGPLDAGGLTVRGSLLGVLDYVAPEQAKDAHSADIRADIYSLGAVLYQCLSGQKPHQNVDPIRKAFDPPRPLREAAPEVPDTLQQIVEQMMAADPAQRYQTPAGASRAIRVFLNAEEQTTPADETAVHADFKELQNYRAHAPGPLADASKEQIAEAVWDQIQPSDRDIIVFFTGIVLLLLLEGLFALLVSRGLVKNFILIALGAGVGWAIAKYVQWRRERS